MVIAETVSRSWYIKPELHCNPVGVPAGALSPPATLSPPNSPSVLPPSPWSPGGIGSSSSSSTISNPSTLSQPAQDRLSAFTIVSGYNQELQRFPTLPVSSQATSRGLFTVYIRKLFLNFLFLHFIYNFYYFLLIILMTFFKRQEIFTWIYKLLVTY